jgi:predicted SprT family Zn-dependent metalloprotease
VDEPGNILEPLAYHIELRDYLKSEERELWNWFSSAKAKADYTENLRLELLKSTYRLDAEGHPELYQSLNEVKARLQLDVPVTLYQAQNSSQLNAALYFIPGQGHVVFSGPVFTLLNSEELKSVIGHELAHYHLWERDAGQFHIADRLIHAVANDPRASASHEQTARRYQLYTEIFADRGSLRVTDDAGPVVAGLVKMLTGLSQVSAASYLKQAGEIFANGNVSTQGVSHPEAFIRARALALWQELAGNAAAPIHGMIEGGVILDELDLLGQKRLTSATQRLLQCLLRPKWFQTPATLGHAKLFFANFRPADGRDSLPVDELKSGDAKLHEFLCYILLDFTKADPELDEMPLAAALELSRQLELDAQFEKLAVKELKLRVRDVRRIKEQAAQMLAKAEANGE